MKIPIRSQICAPKGKVLISVDLSQAEAWVVAYLSDDYNMKEALTKGDIHSLTCCTVYDIIYETIERTKLLIKEGIITDQQRYIGKKCNHAFNYRMTAYKAAEVINKEGNIVVTIKQTKVWYQKYHEFYSVKAWWKEIEEKLWINRTIETCYGFRRHFYAQWGDDLFKEATAFEPQSTVADHAIGAVHPLLGIEGGFRGVYKNIIKPSKGEIRMTNEAYDSCIVECPKEIYSEITEKIVKEMKRPMVINGEEFTIPVDAKVGEHWEQMEKLKVA